MRELLSGALYFAITFAAGFVLGTLRQLLIAPHVGPIVATLVEAPFILTASYFAACWIVGRSIPLPSMAQRAAIGITAFTLLMLTEIIFSWLMRGWSFETWLNHFGTADGAISLAMFLTFAALPLVVRRG